ncbi:YceI family protein [Pseudactinotalea sp.]|uniref:YceI family protein n=1 Tax=Pseudactinotalea sp. TaxID=1926260 RepID=UPI003B3ABD15
MQKRTKVLTGIGVGLVVLVVAVLVGTRLYANWVNSNADEAPTLSETGAPTSEQEEPGVEGDWTVAEGSFAGYRVDEVLNGQDVTVTGRTEDVTGSVTLAGGAVTAGTIEVDLTTVATDESSRDQYFRSEALRTDEFPTATFELTEPAEVVLDGSDLELVGELTVHGVSQQVTATAQAGTSGDGLQVVGSVPITFSDFDVQAPDLGFVVVEDAGAIEFSLELAAG